MKKGLSKAVSFCMMLGLLAQSVYIPAMAEEATTEIAAESDTDTSLVGTLAFAQCEEYINIRESASTDSAVTAKIYNNGSATIEEQDGDWYKIRSGNAEGYVKAEYFVTGEAADAVAQKAAYNVAMVHPTDLNIRSDANEDSEVLATAHEKDELEVVAWDGDWMKVALGGDVYGYVNAYYVDYKTYYPTAETIEEEQARLNAEQEAAEAANYEASDEAAETLPEETYEEPISEEPTADDSSYTEDPSYADGSDETTWTEAPATDETVWTEAPETDAPYTEAPQTDGTTWTEAPETDAPYTEAPETDAPYTEAPETDAPYTEVPETEAPATEAPSTSGVGQQIADFAVQYVGNPYVWGGTSLTEGADCSGFVQTVFANFGLYLSRTAESQSYGGTSISLDNLQPGDLLFYNSTGSIDHVAIYIGGGQIVHAANSSKGIIISNAYYQTPVCARRYC
ncbi:MAG: NlpC/P60 family protein [Lachnospiraceae bacterium]|nr:NlpC/P60 family protein [Lachnospiraceae bacterium]